MLLTQMRDSGGEEDLTYSGKALETEAISGCSPSNMSQIIQR